MQFFFHFSNGGDFFPSSFSSSSFSISVYLYDINMYWVDFGVQNLLWECVCDCVCARVDYVDSNREYELDRKKIYIFLVISAHFSFDIHIHKLSPFLLGRTTDK